MTAKKYFPNNWRLIKNAPEELFQECTYEDFEENRLLSWEMPYDVQFIIRSYNKETHKVKEYVYQQRSAATKRLAKLIDDENNEITICTYDAVSAINLQYGSDGDDE